MAKDIRFPNLGRGAPSELEEVISLGSFTNEIPDAASAGFTDVGVWKIAAGQAPFTHIVVEFTSDNFLGGAVLVNDGTPANTIGLYGQINGPDGGKFLLGILGYKFGAVMPQIFIASIDVGFAQVCNYVAAYDQLTIAGVFQPVPIPHEGPDVTVTVKVRPIHIRDYGG